MPIYTGRGSYIGIGEEVTWGTAVAAARYANVRSFGLQRRRETAPVPDLLQPDTGAVPRRKFTVRDRASGPVEIPMFFEDYVATALAKHALGAVATSGAGPYTHALTLSASLPTGLTIRRGIGTHVEQIYEGCRITRAVWRAAVGEMLMGSFDVIAQTNTGAQAIGTPAYPSTLTPIAAHHATTYLTWNGLTLKIKSFEFIVDNHLTEIDSIGDLNTRQPERSAPTEVLINCTREREDNDLETAYLAETQSDASITFASGSHSVKFDGHNACLESYDVPLNQVGPVEESFTLRCYSDGTDLGGKITWINGNSAVI